MPEINTKMRPSIVLECGPRFFGRSSASGVVCGGAKALINDTCSKYGLGLKVLVYTRDEQLPHTNRNVGDIFDASESVESFYQTLNRNGFPFNLAINGSSDYFAHVPFNTAELIYLERLQASGKQAGLHNFVTVADNALIPVIRAKFPDLGIISSCISVAFEPNLVDFRRTSGLEYSDPQFLIKYYSQLYSTCDKVVPIPQLSTPDFLSALELSSDELIRKTMLFISLGCGARLVGRCIEHYKGKEDRVRPAMPMIPSEYMAKPEDNHADEPTLSCSQSFASLELMNRFKDLRKLRSMGIYQFKIPARDSDSNRVFDFLCRFVTQNDEAVSSFPAVNSIWGYSPANMKLSLIGNYPRSVHSVLSAYSWPRYDGYGNIGYSGHTAGTIQQELHERALAIWLRNNSEQM